MLDLIQAIATFTLVLLVLATTRKFLMITGKLWPARDYELGDTHKLLAIFWVFMVIIMGVGLATGFILPTAIVASGIAAMFLFLFSKVYIHLDD